MPRKGARHPQPPKNRGKAGNVSRPRSPFLPSQRAYMLPSGSYEVTYPESGGQDDNMFVDVTAGKFKGKHFMVSWNPEWQWRPRISGYRPLWFLLNEFGEPLAHDQATSVRQIDPKSGRFRTWLLWEIAG